MSDFLVGLLLTAVAGFFAACAYGQLKARRTGRASAFAPKVGHGGAGRLRGAVAFALLALLFAAGAVGAFGHLAGSWTKAPSQTSDSRAALA